ncbi:AraC-like DNA-binding protein [Streptacidiphilus sp. MAP12-16]|uniref:helix-turn-helix domain-containing protein n=1 Tax=Streptacidiphilus sp. MAP12-16 TaxID=3156300 RepID=UPI003514F43E
MQVYESHSAEELEQYAASSFAPSLAAVPEDFHCRTTLADLGGGIAAGTFQTRPLRIQATRKGIARGDGVDTLMLCIHLSAVGTLEQHGREATISPGVAVLFESGTPFDLRYPQTVESLTLQIPRDLLPLRGNEVSRGLAQSIPLDSPSLQLLRLYLDQLHKVAGSFTAPQRGDAARAAIDLLAMTLRGMAPSVQADDVLVEVLRDHIRASLGDPALTVAELARRHHISVRQVHAVFAKAGSTPADFIRTERLIAARRLLADPAQPSRTVAAVAASVGFSELRTFERAFRREHGLTPSQWRNDLPRPDVTKAHT